MMNLSSMHFLMNGHSTLRRCLNLTIAVLRVTVCGKEPSQTILLSYEHEAIFKDNLDKSELKTVHVINAMAFIQRFQTLGAKTLEQFSKLYLENILTLCLRSVPLFTLRGQIRCT